MKRIAGLSLLFSLVWAGCAVGGDLVFPSSEKEIADTLSFKAQTVVHNGQEYVSTKEGDVFMVIDGKRYRMKGIGGIVNTGLVPKAGALITFDLNSARIKEESYDLLGQYGAVLQRDLPTAKLIIEGHTDNQGSDDYNSLLSEERAQSVKSYLVEHFNISPDRFMIKGAGESAPLGSNETTEGRSINRRVEFVRGIE